jgi:hypothetical protein
MKIPHRRLRSHADFDLTPLGEYAVSRDAAILTPGGRYIQRHTGLPASLANVYAALNGVGQVR